MPERRTGLAACSRRPLTEPEASPAGPHRGPRGLLVAADPDSRSGKAAKARRFQIPVVGADAFLAAGPGATPQATATAVERRETLQCPSCLQHWTRPVSRSKKLELCQDCTETATRSAPTKPGPTSSASPPAPVPAVVGADLVVSVDPTQHGSTSSASPPAPVPAVVGADLVVSVDDAAGTETLRCTACGRDWIRLRTRGRKPHTCPDC
jgi:hypothetical protein